ncbi:hypothetical protein MMC17_002793 [Xylographa soralifera]|nr:hypothetical protein [Xylographa soralifera]
MASHSNFSTHLYAPTALIPNTDSKSSFHLAIITFAIIILTTASSLLKLYFSRSLVDIHGNGIPRGPWGLPVVGSFLFLTQYPELKLDQWAKKFGKLYSIWLGSQLFIIVSDPAVAKDLLVTNGAIFSSRKEMFIKSQTVFAGRGITATPYNDRWRKHRRIATGWLNQHAVDSYTAGLDREATELVRDLFQASKGGSVPVNPQVLHTVHRCDLCK